MSENRRRRNNGAQNRQVKKARTNNARRILLLVGLMSLVAVISIGGTIAWLTDSTGPVTNTFTYGNINIALEETTGNDYKIVPGVDIDKDPTVTVTANSEKCWLFVKVEEENWPTNTEANSTTLKVAYSIDSRWKPLTGVNGVYYQIVESDADDDQEFAVLTDDKITVSENLTKAEVDAITTEPKLTFTAYACQYDGINDTTKDEIANALAAWNAAQPTT